MADQGASGDDRAELFDQPLIGRLAGDRRRRDRDWLTGLIRKHLADPGCRIVLLTGAPGTGKSTVMAHLAEQHRDWPRYFIRRAGESDSDAHLHEGGVTSFLTQIGFQLLELRPNLFSPLGLDLVAELDVAEVEAEGDVSVLRVAEWFANPFRRRAIRALLKAGKVKGRASVVEIGRLVTDAGMAPMELEKAALGDPLRKLAADQPSEHVVVLLDGLDEVRFRDGTTDVARWLTSHPQLPANLRIVVASRPDNPLLSRLRRGHKASTREVPITAHENAGHVARDVDGYLRDLAGEAGASGVLTEHGLTAERFVHELSPKVRGNFLYLDVIARLLDAAAAARQPGSATMLPVPDLDWLDRINALPDELPDFYAMLLLSLHSTVGGTPATREHWEDLYRPLLGLLTATLSPLTGRQLRAFGEIGPDQPTVDGALQRMSFFLDSDRALRGGQQDIRFRLHHTAMAEFLADDRTARSEPILYCDPAAWHGRITDHALRVHKAAGTWRDADPYLRRRLPFHAAEAGRLDELVEEPRYLVAADPDALVPELGAVGDAKPVALIYQQVVPIVRDGHPGSALAHLKLYAEQQGLSRFADSIPMDRESSPWLLDFTRWEGVQLRQVLGRHDGEVTGVAVTRGLDRRPLGVTGGHDGRIRIWDLLAGREEGDPLAVGTWVTALAAGELGDGDAVAVSGDLDGAVRVWDLASRQPVGEPMIGHENAGYAVAAAFTESGPQVVCRIGDQVRAWDLATLEPAHPPFLPADVPREEPMAAASWHGRLLLGATVRPGETGGRVRVWDAALAEPIGPVIEVASDSVTAVALAEMAGSLLVAVADIELGIQVFDAVTGQPRGDRRVFFESPMASALAMGVVRGQPVLATGDESGQIVFREIPSLRRLGDPVQAHGGQVTTLSFGSADSGGWLASSGRDNGGERRASVRFWAPERPRGRLTPAASAIPLREPAMSIALGDVDGRRETVLLDGRRATRWDVGSGAPVGAPVGGRNERVCALGVATVAGRTMAVSATYDKSTVRTWHIPDCAPALHPVTGQHLVRQDIDGVRSLAVTRLHDRAVAVCAGWGEIHVWDVATGEPAGAGLITGPKNIWSLAVGELSGRPIVACAAGSPSEDRLTMFDLETGAPLDHPRLDSFVSPDAVAVARHAGRTLVVAGGSHLSISAWDPASGGDPAVIRVAGETSVLAATYLRGSPVAVCSGRKGEVRLVDLATAAPEQRPAHRQPERMNGLAIANVGGQRVVVCATGDGVRVLDLVTGADAASPPGIRLGTVHAVATGTLHGRPVAVAGGYPNHAWYLDDGEPLVPQPDWPDTVPTLAIADVGGRVIAVADTWSNGLVVVDLETGGRIDDAVRDIPGYPVGVGVATLANRPVLVCGTRDGIRAQYVDLPWLSPRAAEMGYREFATHDETPPPPPLFPAKRLTRYPHSGGWCMTLGSIDGQPVVISGHEGGDIDIVEVASGLPLHPPLGGQSRSDCSAIACHQLGDRQVMAFGTLDGTVGAADLTDLSVQTAIRTLAPVQALALAEPDHCVIGTEKGLITIRLPFPPKAGQDDGTTRRVRPPIDIRAARACREHDQHLQPAERGGHQVWRLCLKGVQQGGIRKADSLSYPGGHCYLLPDRLEIVAAGSAGEGAPPLVIGLRQHMAEPVDDWEGYLTNGCHFGVGVDTLDRYLVLACYRRSERDWLLAEMKKRLGRR
jgi:WD40 repeat protein